jgi:glucan phosphoethanolaminetransferase (alkaline phosphatase superfamily)
MLTFYKIAEVVGEVVGMAFLSTSVLFIIYWSLLAVGRWLIKLKKEGKIMKAFNVSIKLILIILVILFGVYVWPTPYKYMFPINSRPVRMHRITGIVERYYSGRWNKY